MIDNFNDRKQYCIIEGYVNHASVTWNDVRVGPSYPMLQCQQLYYSIITIIIIRKDLEKVYEHDQQFLFFIKDTQLSDLAKMIYSTQ